MTCALLVACGPDAVQPSAHDHGGSSPDASDGGHAPLADETNVAKVQVLADGTILLDEKQVTIVELETAFADTKRKNGVVWYYRENAVAEPPPQAMLVVEAVVEAKLPIKLFTTPDFLDPVGRGGAEEADR